MGTPAAASEPCRQNWPAVFGVFLVYAMQMEAETEVEVEVEVEVDAIPLCGLRSMSIYLPCQLCQLNCKD